MGIQLSQEEERELRRELEFIKEYLCMLNHIRKYAHLINKLVDNFIEPYSFVADLNKAKMALVKEIGHRRKNMNILGIKPRFPGDR